MRTAGAALLMAATSLMPEAGLRSLQAQAGIVKGPSSADLSIAPARWAEEATRAEEHIINYDQDTLLRYRVRKRDAKGEVVREVIESKEGSVARLLQRDGRPLTAEENAAERERLEEILSSPDAFLRRVRRDEGSKSYAVELLRSMPKAMIWSYVPGQPQLPGAQGPAVVLDFKPDPAFKPPSLITEGLRGIAGRLWIDTGTHCATRIQGDILHSVDFGWGGVLARVKEGGHIEFDQRQVTAHRWLYAHLAERISIREVLVHTVDENSELTTLEAQPLPAQITYRQAVQMLLAMPVVTR